MTQAVVEARDGSWRDRERRVWVFTYEVNDGAEARTLERRR
jgi:hypothetical protein